MTEEIREDSDLAMKETPPEAMELSPLDTFDYKYKGKEITISFTCPEFTAIDAFSDFADFGVIRINYVPKDLCVELKSLKLYINSFRSVKILFEHVVNRILQDFVSAIDPIAVDIEGDFNVRGSIKTVIRGSYR
jgi:7-cyano-7-deazaguanine reductase